MKIEEQLSTLISLEPTPITHIHKSNCCRLLEVAWKNFGVQCKCVNWEAHTLEDLQKVCAVTPIVYSFNN